MDNNELNKLLDQLHDEIQKTRTVDEKSSELLRDLDADINTLLKQSGEIPVRVNPSITQRLESALNHFETTHPDLTKTISKLLDILCNAGI